jgi:DNA adenine methylase
MNIKKLRELRKQRLLESIKIPKYNKDVTIDMPFEVPTFVKWAGGKRQLLPQLSKFLPKKVEGYFEPFIGGGAMAFYIIKKYNPERVFLSDINEELINALNIIRTKTNELMTILLQYRNSHSEKFYYQMRDKDPIKLNDIERAARFIYLNKTGYNGLYRVNSKGKFNVPFGRYKNPSIFSEKDFREISYLLKNAHIEVKQFYEAVSNAKSSDFIYFDPPYYPLKKGKNFTKYTKGDFLDKEQEKLAEVFKDLDRRGCKVMLSNSDTDFIKGLYTDYIINKVKAKRMINCDATKRGEIDEVVITNY